MGRTVPSFRQVIDEEIRMLQRFRSALRKEDQELFDSLMRYSKSHISAGSYSSRLNPFESMVLAMLLEQQREIARLRKEMLDAGLSVRLDAKAEGARTVDSGLEPYARA
jgi:hypothetical protein